jgi:hypothetical protein
MINKINKERRLSMNATPTRPSSKNQWQEAQEDSYKKGQGARQSTDRLISKIIHTGKRGAKLKK